MLATSLYLIVILTSFIAILEIVKKKKMRFPSATLFLCVCLGVCLIAQSIHPELLLQFERNTLEVQGGQWWRIFTALFFQDGGVSGGLYNIFFLALIGVFTERMWKRSHWLLIYFGTGLIAECVALSWQPIGAGNSIAVFGLAASALSYTLFKKVSGRASVFADIAAFAALGLVLLGDIHGAAYFIGAVVSLLIIIILLIQSNNKTNQKTS